MMELHWLQATDPKPLLQFLRGKTTGRKLRLFACACCRHIWHLLADERSLCRFIDERGRLLFRDGMPLRDACGWDGFGSAADAVQTVPAVLYVLMCHAGSFEEAVVAAVNDTKDNDSVASIVGAILGALHGRKAIPTQWLDGITSSSLAAPHDQAGDDREVIDWLTRQAVEKFV